MGLGSKNPPLRPARARKRMKCRQIRFSNSHFLMWGEMGIPELAKQRFGVVLNGCGSPVPANANGPFGIE